MSVVKLASVKDTTIEERISKFAEAWVNGANKTESYAAAGYSCPTASNAYNFFKKHQVAIVREVQLHLQNKVPLALKTLAEIMVNGKSETARVKASLEILDRGGFDKQTRIQINEESPKSQEDLKAQLKELLTSNPDIMIDGE